MTLAHLYAARRDLVLPPSANAAIIIGNYNYELLIRDQDDMTQHTSTLSLVPVSAESPF